MTNLRIELRASRQQKTYIEVGVKSQLHRVSMTASLENEKIVEMKLRYFRNLNEKPRLIKFPCETSSHEFQGDSASAILAAYTTLVFMNGIHMN